jgi:dienelactone hydrolase
VVEPFEIGPPDRKVRGVLSVPGGGGISPCVILSHGLLSSKESSKYLALSDALGANGIGSCRFDYHGCGESDGNIEETTLSERLANLESVTALVLGHPSIDGSRVGLLGSSFGGCTSLVRAARDSRIRCVCLWATPYRLGSKEEPSPEGIDFREDLYADFARYDLLRDARKVRCGLVIHGEADEVVPAEEGAAIYENLCEPKAFELIRGGDHTFSRAADRERAISLSLDWLGRFLL